ncbi:MAG: response regulator, partial [Magnetococcales bacterium]|nr:response regulator [Magnetococcales bacterium]
MDFILFLNGFSCLLLSVISFLIFQRRVRILPWLLLGGFGLFQGMGVWLELIALHTGDPPWFSWLRSGVFVAAPLLLGGFAVLGFHWEKPRHGWIAAASLTTSALLGWILFRDDPDRYLRLGLITPAALASALLFWRRFPTQTGSLLPWLRLAAVVMGLYAVLKGWILDPTSPFSQGTETLHGLIPDRVDHPAQWVNGILMMILTFAIGGFDVYQLEKPEIRSRNAFYFLTVLLGLILMLAAGANLTERLNEVGDKEFLDDLGRTVEPLANRLNLAIHQTEINAFGLSSRIHPLVRNGLPAPENMAGIQGILDATGSPGERVAYLMDVGGTVVASSNRQTPDSFVGNNASSRPDFQQAVSQGLGRFFAVGTPSGKAGYHASVPVLDGMDQLIGVAVIQQNLIPEHLGFANTIRVFLVGPEGISLLSGSPKYAATPLWPLSEQTLDRVLASKQYGSLDHRSSPPLAHSPFYGEIVRFEGVPHIVGRLEINMKGWYILALKEQSGLSFEAMLGIVVTLMISLLMITTYILLRREATILNDARQLAVAASRAKSEFLANMSHEIRSPLNAIIGLTDLVLHTRMSRDEEKNNLHIVHSSSLSLLDLINGILDLSKIEAGHFLLDTVPFDIVGRVENACDMLAIKAHQKGLELYCHISSEIPPSLEGDPLRLKQILVNLITNAIKFTPFGEVVVSITVDPKGRREEHAVQLLFTVSDTGIGIPKDKQALIFGDFIQADGSTSRKYGGTGLGLSISRHLVHLMGGDLQVESHENQGSRFHFSLRLPISREQKGGKTESCMLDQRRTERHDSEHSLEGKRILLADHHPTGREVVLDMLNHFGCQTTVVETLPALRNALSPDTDHPPFDCLIVDEGIFQTDTPPEVAHSLVAPGGIVIMISTHSGLNPLTLDDFFKCAQTVKKPLGRFRLLKKLRTVFSRSTDHDTGTDGPAESGSSTTFDIHPMNILLVEDLPENQKLAIAILKPHGHTIQVANHGGEALERLRNNVFDLILMDLQMPVMDGFETARRIRAETSGTFGPPNVPIVAVSAMFMMNEKNRCLQLGMNDFLLKPYRPRDLLGIIAPYGLPKETPTPEPREEHP